MRYFIIVPDYWTTKKKPRERPCRPPVRLRTYLFLSESALCPAPTGSVSFNVVHIKSDWMVMLSDGMVMVMPNGNGNDNNVGHDNGNGNGDGESDVRVWT